MSKQSFRNITILNNGTQERWKWRYGTKDTIIMAPDGKKSYVATTKLSEAVEDGDSGEHIGNTVSPRSVAQHIYGIIGQPMPIHKPKVEKIVPQYVEKSRVYLIIKEYTYRNPDYPCFEKNESIYEIYQDASKAKMREQELNAVAKKMYIFDELNSGSYYGKKPNRLLDGLTYHDIDKLKDTDDYKYIIKEIEYSEYNRSVGYKFIATEREIII